MTHFVWYLEREKRYDIETLPNRPLSKEKFYWKIMHKKLVADPFSINPKQSKTSMECKKLFKNTIFWKKIIKS